MLEVLVSAAVNVALFVLAVKVWLWSRKQAKLAATAWRRRVGLLFFLLPIVAVLLEWLVRVTGLPDVALAPVNVLMAIREGINWALERLVGLTKEGGTLWSIALRPLCYTVVYGGVGVLIGWPLDRLAQARELARAAPAAGGPTTKGGMPMLGEGEKHDGWSA